MNNLLEFEQYQDRLRLVEQGVIRHVLDNIVNEANKKDGKVYSKKSERSKWKDIIIEPSDKPENGSIIMKVTGELDDYTQGEVLDILADDYKMLVTLTGKNNAEGFYDKLKNSGILDVAIELKNASNKKEENGNHIDSLSYEFAKEKGGSYIETLKLLNDRHNGVGNDKIKRDIVIPSLFTCVPDKSKGGFGKGEILLAAYYNNIKRSLEKRSGGDFGDCTVVNDGNENKGYIEVKTHGAGFDTYVGRVDKDVYKLFNCELGKISTEIYFTNHTKPENQNITKYENIINYLSKFFIGGIYKYGKSRKKDNTPLDLIFFDDNSCKNKNEINYLSISIENTLEESFKNIVKNIDKIIIRLADADVNIIKKCKKYFKNDNNPDLNGFYNTIKSIKTCSVSIIGKTLIFNTSKSSIKFEDNEKEEE